MKRFTSFVVVSIALIITLAPVYWMITISLKREIDQFAVPPRWFSFSPTLEHYADAFIARSFGSYLLNSAIVALASRSRWKR